MSTSSSAAASSAASSSSSSAAAQPAPLPTAADFDSLLTSKRYSDLLGVAQRRELEEGGVYTKDSELWYCIELYAAGLAGELLTSKFVWKRIPKEMKKKNKDLAVVWRLLQSLHRNDFATFFTDADSLQSSLSTPTLQRLNQTLRAETQAKNILNIRRAYTTIGVEQAAQLLGTKKDTTAAFLTSLRWTLDTTKSAQPGQYFNPTPLEIPKGREISVEQIESLTRYVTELEDE